MFVSYVLPWVITQMNFLTKNICFNFQVNKEKIKRNYIGRGGLTGNATLEIMFDFDCPHVC